MKSFTREQFASLLKVAKTHSESDYLALLLGFHHGLRVSEILALGRENVIEGRLVVQRLKGSRKTTQMLLTPAKEMVEARVAAGEEKFFHVCRKTFWLHMKQYAAEAGVPLYLAHPHTLKHTSGRLAYLGGMGLPEIGNRLGHVNLGNTMIYMQSSEDEADKAFAAAVGL